MDDDIEKVGGAWSVQVVLLDHKRSHRQPQMDLEHWLIVKIAEVLTAEIGVRTPSADMIRCG